MAISPICDFCKKELLQFGAVLLSPPDAASNVHKMHVCTNCYDKMMADNGLQVDDPKTNT